MMKTFIKGIVKENWEDIARINKVIKETGHTDLMIETNDIIAVDTGSSLGADILCDHVEKCKTKITQKDYTGDITNARSLLEVVFLKIIKDNHLEYDPNSSDAFKGDLVKMYSAIKKTFSSKKEHGSQIIQLLSGITSIVDSISGLSNSSLSDRHGHLLQDNNQAYAELIVNLVFSISLFLIKDMD